MNHRQPSEIWHETRRKVWHRDNRRCQSPPGAHKAYCTGENHLLLRQCQIDHIIPLSRGGTNELTNLRTLCPVCHALRADSKHRALIYKLLCNGSIPPDWHKLVWE